MSDSDTNEIMDVSGSNDDPHGPTAELSIATNSADGHVCCKMAELNDDPADGPSVRRKFKNLPFGRKKKPMSAQVRCKDSSTKTKKKSSTGWGFKLCARTESCNEVDQVSAASNNTCICTGYRRTDDQTKNDGDKENPMQSSLELDPLSASSDSSASTVSYENLASQSQQGDENRLDPEQHVMNAVQARVTELAIALRHQLAITVSPYPYLARWSEVSELTPGLFNRICLRGDNSLLNSNWDNLQPIHTQVDYIHCLVPDLLSITNCSFYWGKMDRYEAEKLLENRPEGTFLLRDSAQEEHLFSVSFRRFDRSLHARIEQYMNRFSFDSHDPGVFSSETVCGLIEHYKDPSHCMFFEPMLLMALHRKLPFSLQHLCRANICSKLTYNNINRLMLPKRLKSYLKEYHYKQQVRVRRFEADH